MFTLPRFLEIYQSAMDLYGVIHARFILSPHGLNKMREKFLQGAFGTCPRVLCERQHVLPIGVSEELSTSRVKVYCPRCVDVYLPRQKQLDIDSTELMAYLQNGATLSRLGFNLEQLPALFTHRHPRIDSQLAICLK